MKNFKRLFVIFATLVATLSACQPSVSSSTTSSSNSNTTITDPSEDDPVFSKFTGELERNVEIKVVENDTAIKMGYLDELIEAFNEEYKEYGITAVDANQGEFADLPNTGPYGYGPDVVYQANDVLMGWVQDKHIMPLPTHLIEAYQSDVIPQTAHEAYKSVNNNVNYTFGVPVNIQSPLLYYRKDLLPSDWQETWDDNDNDVPDMVENIVDLYQFSLQYHEQDNSKYGFEFSLNDFYFTSGYLFSYGAYLFGDNNRDDTDIGLHQGNAKYGVQLLRQFAAQMSPACIDDSAKLGISGAMASGKYFASVTTPDVRSVIVDALATTYQDEEGLTSQEAIQKAEENVVGVPFPSLPANGDLINPSEEMIECKQMGGINGFAMSSYTKYPNASLAFINFATSYKMVKLREEIIQIAPCRSDVASESNELSQQLFEKASNGSIVLMPSIKAINQVWTPAGSFMGDVAADPSRGSNAKYDTLDKIQAALEQLSKDIYDAIHLLS